MASRDEKDQQLRRFAKAQRHLVSHEEERARKQARRHTPPGKQRPRARQWDADADADAFAPMPKRTMASAPAARHGVPADAPHGTVTAVHGNGIELDGVPARLAGAMHLAGAMRPVVGDAVAYEATAGPPRVLSVLARRTVLARPDPGNPHHQLVLAADVDVAVIVVAASSAPLRSGLIDRCLVALARTGIAAVVCANKVDRLDAATTRDLDAALAPHAALAVPVCRCSAHTGAGLDTLRSHLLGRTAVFLGKSGVGKSSLLNALDPAGARAVTAVRAHDDEGRHTTTSANLRRLADGLPVIDTPGVRAVGLDTPTPDELHAAFAEFAPFATGCRFGDCTHVHEPDCAVRDAVATGRLSAARHASYCRIRLAANGDP